ncbi:hypothetical protein [Variovorax paradoxus]
MNMVAVPFAAFQGIDTSTLAQSKLEFPKAAGKVAITGIEFQKRERP